MTPAFSLPRSQQVKEASVCLELSNRTWISRRSELRFLFFFLFLLFLFFLFFFSFSFFSFPFLPLIFSQMEQQFKDAANDGRIDDVESLLRDNPGLDVNWGDKGDNFWTALHSAVGYCHPEVVELLLAHPAINVNALTEDGRTPLSYGCQWQEVSVVQLLLKDQRVDTSLADDCGRTPLMWAAETGRLEVTEWLIASGRDLGDIYDQKARQGDDEDYTALEIARKYHYHEVVSLLERFMANQRQTRYELRVKLGLLDELTAEVFALTVFLCDDLLQFKPASSSSSTKPDAARFFAIAAVLPMELQMILCYRVVGSMKQNLRSQDSEVAFKSLARIDFVFDEEPANL